MEPEANPAHPPPHVAALAGVVAAGAALAAGEVAAGASADLDSPVVAVGDSVIERVPRPIKDLAIDWFGTGDKVALVVGIVVLALLFGAGVGLLARRRRWWGVAGLGAFALLGAVAAHTTVGAPWFASLPSLVAWIVGSATLVFLLGLDRADAEARRPGATSRRQFVIGAAAVVGAGALLGSIGRWLQARYDATASRLAVVLPRATRPKAPVPAGVDLHTPGVGPWYTPNSDFYRIDVNLTVPQIAAESWALRIHGMVERELVLGFEDLLARDLVEEDITLLCVSNEVGGDLVGNARWLGARLDELLDEVGVLPGADQVVGRSSDGFTTGFPLSTLDDGRTALVAVGMNGEPLPNRHGFPARLVVPGLYGYVSATKWLTEIELTRFDEFDQYWVVRGWSDRGPIKVMSRIDTPRAFGRVVPGRAAIGGVAWAQPVGVDRVEVRIDDGAWRDAVLGEDASGITWRQWRHEWDATPGRHTIAVRATDRDGQVQTEQRATPFPDGATGWHQVVVDVG